MQHNTDVVALAIAVSSVLQDCEIWVACAMAPSYASLIPSHIIAAKLGNDGSWGILLTHALSG